MTTVIQESPPVTEQSEFQSTPPDILNYWDQAVPRLIFDQLKYASSLGEPTKWGTELAKKSGAMIHEAQQFAPVMRERTDRLLLPNSETSPREYMDQVFTWYHSLGTTADLSEAAITFLPIYDRLKNVQVAKEQTSPRDLLAGELLHDLALANKNPDLKNRLLAQAKREYSGLLKKPGNWQEKNKRDAAKYFMDATFEQLFIAKDNGVINSKEFEKQYMDLQSQQANHLMELSKNENHVPTGELYEEYAVLMSRHVAWRDENHEQTEVRHAMPREDEARYPWSTARDPIWSYDMVVKTPNSYSMFQLKSEDMSYSLDNPHYLPSLVTVVTNKSSELRHNIQLVAGSVYRMYGSTEQVIGIPRVDDDVIKKASEQFEELV